ncbi:hypothetical protein SAMN05444008_11984 [Cnuella takakiae]|uniref:YcxB-like protein n=1 Tax=Cnuella takakiae TaxID=1302690 RepID=A0A1M5HK26_9BACT|nr:hypothetical protein [Cnuella takakiae]OLY92895.1 hypothetical protein BUE76_14105 [Cnuella takakiae]SHG16182.1 hypothetical protein SAMN05444008_11984 [Cnuella takakiae]
MFEIPINIPGLEKRRRSIGLLHIVAGFFLIANAENVFRALALRSYAPLLPLFGVALISLVYGFIRKKLDPQSRYNFWLRLLQAVTFLSLAFAMAQAGNTGKSLGLFLWVVIAGGLAFTERIALQQQKLDFSEKGFAYPNGYTHKEVPWAAVADVTVRPDFLTIHYPDNRFLQFELKQPIDAGKVAEMQEFCRRQITSGKA